MAIRNKAPFAERAKVALLNAGYKQDTKRREVYHKAHIGAVVLKNKYSSDMFKGYHHQVAGLVIQDGHVLALSPSDILNCKGVQ